MEHYFAEYLIRVSVHFMVSGNIPTFDELTDIVGLFPTTTKNKEDFAHREYATDIWEYETDYMKTLKIDEPIVELQSIIYPQKNAIKAYCDRTNTKISFHIVVQSADNNLPEMTLSKEFIQFAALFDADIDFDIYCDLGSERFDDT